MKSVDTGQDKVKKICEVLKKETIEPAKKEADSIIHHARNEAKGIIEKANLEAKRIHAEAKMKIDEEKNVFQASINLAAKKCLAALKQEIEERLFNKELDVLIKNGLKDTHIIAALISAMVKGIEKNGMNANLEAIISEVATPREINQELTSEIIKLLEKESVQIGDIEGGVLIKIKEKNMTIDMSAETLKNLIAKYIREDFRSVIFST